MHSSAKADTAQRSLEEYLAILSVHEISFISTVGAQVVMTVLWLSTPPTLVHLSTQTFCSKVQ